MELRMVSRSLQKQGGGTDNSLKQTGQRVSK